MRVNEPTDREIEVKLIPQTKQVEMRNNLHSQPNQTEIELRNSKKIVNEMESK